MKFDSPIGKTTINSGEGMKVFSVPNAEGPGPNLDAEFDAQLQEMQMPAPGQRLSFEEASQIRANWAKKAQQNQTNVEEEFIKRVELLTGIARGKKDVVVEIGGRKSVWTLRTLKSSEQKTFAGFLQSLQPLLIGDQVRAKPTDMIELKKIALKYSIYQVDGILINTALGTEMWPQDKQMMAVELMIDEMDDALVDYLYGQYEMMVKEHNSRFSIKNEADIKEVADAINKSGKGPKA